MRNRAGMTLVEILVALLVFAVVLSIAYGAIVGSLRMQADQEALTTTHAKLRRIVEVVGQDLRSAVFGSITDSPYRSDEHQVSFMLLTGGAGYPVLPHDKGNNDSFMNAANVDIVAADATHLIDRKVVMINGNGTGVLLDITGASRSGNDGSWNLKHPQCSNTIPYTPGTLIFAIETHGLRFDHSRGAIYSEVGSGSEVPFAFDVSGLRFDYVYTSPTAGEPAVHAQPFRSGGRPVRTYQRDGHTYTLTRLQVVVEGDAISRGRTNPRAYSAQVDLSGNEHFTLKELVPCS